MFAWVALAVGLFTGTAHAADLGGLPAPAPADQMFLQNPISDAQAKKDAEEKAKEERLKALEAAQSKMAARVVVLAWPDAPQVNYDNGGVQSNVKALISRPDAKFVPDIDLYQVGRVSPDKSLTAAQQPGSVPQGNVDIVNAAVKDIETVPWNGMSESDWGITANSLLKMVDKIWFVDRPELREPLFQLYVQIGRAAENMNNPIAPFYQQVGGQLINYYWYEAGTMAYEDPKLLDSLTYPDLKKTIAYYKGLLDAKKIPFMTLSFEQGGVWDPKKFAGNYKVYINGLEVLITDPKSLYEVPPGRVDIFLKRADGGYSIADSVQLDKLQGKIYFVRDTARKRMGVDLIQQLMKFPDECTPRVESDILTGLAIYAKLQPDAEIYVAVPVAGDAAKTKVWRWDRETGTLSKVLDTSQGYPIRFAVIGGLGTQFAATPVPCTPITDPNTATTVCKPNPPTFAVAGVPFFGELRAHYHRLMIMIGGTLMPSTAGPVSDRFNGAEGAVYDPGGQEVLNTSKFSYEIFGGVGAVLLKKAHAGIGPRVWLRYGAWNLPHVMDLTAHGGITMEPPGKKDQKGRVRLVLDADGWAGMNLPYGNTQLDKSKPLLALGLSVGAGTTF